MSKAISDYSKAIEINPNHGDYYFNRGNAEKDKKDFDAAINDFTKAVQLNSKDAESYKCRGDVKQEKSDLNGALTDYKQACVLDPGNNDYKSALAGAKARLNQ